MSPRLPNPLLAVQTDGRLTELASAGNERAFEALFRRYRPPLLRYCRGLGLGEAQAEDVLQQSFTNAWLALGRGADVRELRPWLYRVVHNSAVSALRRPSENVTDPLPEAREGGPLVAGALEHGLRARDALGHVAALPPMQREAVVLAAIQGRSHEEVAGVLGVSDVAVRGLLHRARRTLRSAAAALAPDGLIGWLARGPAGLGAAERSGELAAGGGAVGVAGAVLKGAFLAVSASVVVAGGIVVREGTGHRASRPRASASSAVQGARSDRSRPAAVALQGSVLTSVSGIRHGESSERRRGGRSRESGPGARAIRGRGGRGDSLFSGRSGGTGSGRDDGRGDGAREDGSVTGTRADGRGGDGSRGEAAPVEVLAGSAEDTVERSGRAVTSGGDGTGTSAGTSAATSGSGSGSGGSGSGSGGSGSGSEGSGSGSEGSGSGSGGSGSGSEGSGSGSGG